MRRGFCLFFTGLFAFNANMAFACVIYVPTPFEKFMRDNVLNESVAQNNDCSFSKGGRFDDLTGEPAVDLGKGRIGQSIKWDRFLVVMCDEKQAVVLNGVSLGVSETSCGPMENFEIKAYLPPGKKFDFQAGDDFSGFLQYAKRFGMSFTEDLKGEFQMEKKRDRVDLLCGCKLFYPESSGAQD